MRRVRGAGGLAALVIGVAVGVASAIGAAAPTARAQSLGPDGPKDCVPPIGTNQIVLPLPGVFLPLPSIGGGLLPELDRLPVAAANLGLPGHLNFRDSGQGFNQVVEVVLRDGSLYAKPRGAEYEAAPWRRVPTPPCLDGQIVAVSVDQNMLVALDDQGWMYSLDNLLSGPMLWSWTRSWIYYQQQVLQFHSSLTNSAGNHHPWESKPWTWPMSLRPMLYFIDQGEQVSGCGQGTCVRAIMLIGTPAMWWLAVPVLAWAFWRAVLCRDGRYVFPLVGYAAGLVPWFFQFDRQMYFFYGAVLLPFYVMMLALICGEIAGRREDSEHRRLVGRVIVCLYVGLVIANFVYLWPILVGSPITQQDWSNHLWLPSWR